VTEPLSSIAGRAERILFVRLSAIGDLVFASPLISALRRARPDAHIAWLVRPECAPLLDRHPDLDEIIRCPVADWARLWRRGRLIELARSIRRLRAELHARRFDLAIDLQGLLKSGLLTRLSGAPERVGLGSREGSQWLMTRRLPRGGESKRISSEYLYLAEQLGLPVPPFDMAVHYDAADAAFADDVIAGEGLAGGYAVLCPFTTRPQKHWIGARWAPLAARVHDDLGLIPALLGGPSDRGAAGRIAAAAGGPLVDLTGRTSLRQAAALIHRARLLVAVDTGLGHMGIAFGRPSLLLFGSTCPYLDTTRANARVLYHRMDCSPCKRRPTCEGRFDCMRAIGVDEVIAAAGEVMDVPSARDADAADGPDRELPETAYGRQLH
jgi:heptosyltransferase-1